MATVLLVRHGRTASNTSGILAGRTPGVGLDDEGRSQATALAERAADLPIVRIVSSPLQRTMETATFLAEHGGTKKVPRPDLQTDDRLLECDYGDWTGKGLKALGKEPMWRVVQSHPSAAVFPGGEGLADVASRAVAAIRDHDRQVTAEYGPGALWVAVSHGDVLKAILADALGTHLDSFQRIVVDPCSVSVVAYTGTRPFVQRTNDRGGDFKNLIAPRSRRRSKSSSDAAVGGGAG